MRTFLMTMTSGAVVVFLLENILSEGGMKKTVKFVLGLVYIALLLAPILDWLRGGSA